MARLCIRIKPNLNTTDPSLDVLRTQEGDVVCVKEDGHVFSHGELNCGQYRFIDVPGAVPADLAILIKPSFDAGRNLIRKRSAHLDPAVLSGVAWRTVTTATKAQIDSITVVKS